MNFGSTNWLNQNKSLEIQQNVKYFYNTFIFNYDGSWSDILLFYLRVMLYP